MTMLSPTELEPFLVGHVDLKRRPDSVQPLRLPVAELGFYDAFNRWVASCTAGVRLRFSTDSRKVTLKAAQRLLAEAPGDERRGAYDLYVDRVLAERSWGDGGATLNLETGQAEGDEAITVAFDLPAGDKIVELWLPQAATVSILGLELDDGAKVSAAPDTRKKILFHGSSISHCMEATGASAGWPAVAAGLAGLNHQNLGWAGSCMLSGQAARIIRDAEADAIVLKLGINVHTDGQLKERVFLDSAHAMISIIRERHKDTPLVIASPIFSASREDLSSLGGPSLVRMRELLKAVVASRQAAGDKAIRYLDGLELFSAADAHLLPDDLHPNTEGYRLMGERFHRLLLSGPDALI